MNDGKETAARVADLTGWTPPIVYDLATDAYRIATQDDVDRLQRIANAYSTLVSQTSRLIADQRETLQRIPAAS